MASSDPPRPPRPTRRSSAMRPAARGVQPTAPSESALQQAEVADPVAAASSAVSASKASDEARIAKVMARAGLCSRRDAEAWIRDGRVAVNGAVIDSPALNVGPRDAVTVDGYPIDKPEHTRLFLFNKARGLVTTARDPEGRPTVFDVLPAELPRLVTIGRLDINTEGLLLLTNDGGLARLLELPSTGWLRRYRVRANGTTDQARLDALAKGISIDGVAYAGIAAKLDRVQGANLWLTMGLKEGKNREIKRVLEHLGLVVTRLIRISFGPFQLGALGDNAVEEVRTRVLRDQLGSALAREAGITIDLDGPTDEERQERSTKARNTAAADPPRRLTRRTATADRRGRAVAVEHVSTALARGERADGRREDAAKRPRPATARPDRPGSHGRASRPERERVVRSDDGPQRPRAPSRGGDADRGFGSRAAHGEERGGKTSRSAAPKRPSERPSRPPSRDEDRPVRRADRSTGDRLGRSGSPPPTERRGPPRAPRPDRAGGDPARFGGKPGGRPGGGKPGGKGRPRRG